jgi:hypothetical protein
MTGVAKKLIHAPVFLMQAADERTHAAIEAFLDGGPVDENGFPIVAIRQDFWMKPSTSEGCVQDGFVNLVYMKEGDWPLGYVMDDEALPRATREGFQAMLPAFVRDSSATHSVESINRLSIYPLENAFVSVFYLNGLSLIMAENLEGFIDACGHDLRESDPLDELQGQCLTAMLPHHDSAHQQLENIVRAQAAAQFAPLIFAMESGGKRESYALAPIDFSGAKEPWS